jgi:putative MATE family efflux protein
MTEGSPTKLIVLFALPLMLGNVGQQLYTVIDAVIVGRGVGVSALAALGAADWPYWLYLWSFSSFAQGFSILLSQRFGARDGEGLRKAYTMSMLLALGLGALFSALGLITAKPILTALATPEDIFPGAISYLYTLFSGAVITMGYSVSSAVLRSLGDSRTPLAAMIISSVVNIGLDLLFVMVFNWGIVGAAAATVIAQLFALLLCIRALFRIELLRVTKEDWRPDIPVLKRLLGLGFPLALQHVIIGFGGMILQSVINSFGFLFVAGFTATNKMYGILESTGIALGYSMSTYMGQNMGAGKTERMDSGIKAVFRLSIAVSATISVSMFLFGRSLLSQFVSREEAGFEQVIEIGYRYLTVMSATLLILYLLHTYRSSLQGLGNTAAPLFSGVMEFFMRVGAALILPRFMGETGVFFAETCAWLGAVLILIPSFYGTVRRIKRKVSHG